MGDLPLYVPVWSPHNVLISVLSANLEKSPIRQDSSAKHQHRAPSQPSLPDSFDIVELPI